MLGSGAFLDGSRRESRKKRRLSERRRVFSRLGGTTTTGDLDGDYLTNSSFSQSRDRRRSSIFKRNEPQHQQQQQDDSGATMGFLMAASDQGKIAMKIQFHITVAPDNEPLLLDTYQLITAPLSAGDSATNNSQNSPVERQVSAESSLTTSAISEHISERLNRQSSSTRRRQQLLAMHQQPALDKHKQQQAASNIRSEDNLTFVRSGSISGNRPNEGASMGAAVVDLTGGTHAALGREPGVRSSTISGGMQDQATLEFLAKQNQMRQQNNANLGGSITSTGSLLGQHQTLMSSSNNMRQRQEQREHIFFKRDGQRFGHEFTLKLAVDKSYRCLLKVRPLIPLEALSVQGHHVSFVDCSSTSSFSSSGSSGFGSSLSSSAPASSMALSGAEMASATLRHQSIGNILNSPRHNSIASTNNNNGMLLDGSRNIADQNCPTSAPNNRFNHHQRRLNHAQTTIGSGVDRRTSILNSDLVRANPLTARRQEDVSGSNLSLTGAHARLQQQLLKQQQHNQMVRHFSASSTLSSSHMGGQLLYMFDWSAGRFEVNKNKARTQVQTVLKFKNGQILSLPLQVKFYEAECKQHLNWGSQLHFVDYDCQIDSMGQMKVDRVQYY